MSRVTFIECSSLYYVLFNREVVGFININGFVFYNKTKKQGLTWNTFTEEEKEEIKKRIKEVKNDRSAWGQ